MKTLLRRLGNRLQGVIPANNNNLKAQNSEVQVIDSNSKSALSTKDGTEEEPPVSDAQLKKQQKLFNAQQSSRLINKLLAQYGFEDYLEVGVQNGVTFNDISAPRRDAVDPRFLFDTSGLANDETRYFQMRSDDFFASACDKTYDVIFLDGLHTFEQCYRDFCAALQCLREPGVIIIDDTIPGDFFSSLRTQDDAIAAREQHGLNGRAWTGDVFKVVLMLHEFYPNLDFVTLRDSKNPAHKPNTLVWRSKRVGFAPIHSDVRKIAETGFFDLPSLESAFRFAETDDGLSRLFSSKPAP